MIYSGQCEGACQQPRIADGIAHALHYSPSTVHLVALQKHHSFTQHGHTTLANAATNNIQNLGTFKLLPYALQLLLALR